jgi:short subunit dehydrogenase-like uncharacterized protein
MTDKHYDLIVFGATSFVGQIVCQYLSKEYEDKSLRWAAAGRSESKLRSLQQALGATDDTLPILLANADEPSSLEALCHQCDVIISTVGPYALFGEPMVKACVETGTDYCDLTGESPWIQQMAERYQEQAEKTGARIVHCCGFDSIPSDLGVYFLQQQAHAQQGDFCATIKMRVKAMKGGLSGGTAASLINVIKQASKDPALRKSLANPYSICPPSFQPKTRQHNISGAEFDRDTDSWIAPFFMAAINTRVVHRSNALAGPAYGEQFRYDEAVITGTGFKGRIAATAMSAAITGLMIGSAIPPTRWILERFVLPKPGEGPSPENQLNGFYDLLFIGEMKDGSRIRCKVTGDRDPGYGSTAKMLSQSAICLKATDKTTTPGGIWTPATAMGQPLIERLVQYAGLTFERLD